MQQHALSSSKPVENKLEQHAAAAVSGQKPIEQPAAPNTATTTPAEQQPCDHHAVEVVETPFEIPGGVSEVVFGSILQDAARDVFGLEQLVIPRMHSVFANLLSGPVLSALDMLQGGMQEQEEQEGSAARARFTVPPFFMAPPFLGTPPLLRGVVDAPLRQAKEHPFFEVIMTTSSSSRHHNNDISTDHDEQPTWEQQVVISSSDPQRLQELAGMFEQQLEGNQPGRKLKGLQAHKVSTVAVADVAQVLLVAARKLRALPAAH